MPAWSFRAAATLGAALSIAYFLFLLRQPLDPSQMQAADDVISTLAPFGAGLLCLRRYRRRVPSEGAGWFLLGISCLLWSGGGAAWTYFEVLHGQEVPFPSLADAGYLGSVPFALAGVIGVAGLRQTFAGGLRAVLDALLAAGAMLFVSWASVLQAAFSDDSSAGFGRIISLAYPIADATVATMALLALARARGERRLVVALLGVGLTSAALADSAFAWFVNRGDYATGNLLDTGYFVAYGLIGLAALRPVPDPERAGSGLAGAELAGSELSGSELSGSELAGRVNVLLPYLPLAIAGLVTVGLHLRRAPVDSFLFWDGLFLVAVVLGRQLVGLFANQALGRELQASLTALREREVELQHQAFHDSLTGLPNRSLFAGQMSRAVGGRDARPVYAMLLDLDGFKQVNDTYGHPAGDRLLVIVADRLRLTTRAEDLVARLGGDEFAILLSPRATREVAEILAARIIRTLREPADLGTVTVTVQGSLGLVEAGPDDTLDDILRHADMAMYEAKRGGKDRFVVRTLPRAPVPG